MQEEYDAIFRYESRRLVQNPGTHEGELVICKPFFPFSRLYSQITS